MPVKKHARKIISAMIAQTPENRVILPAMDDTVPVLMIAKVVI